MDVKKVLSNLTIDEKIELVSGTKFMFTNKIDRLNIKSIEMSDGPHGLRKQIEGSDNGTSNSEIATSFPTAATTASSWNLDNPYKIGQAIARECLYYEVNVLLGPGVNIKRNPLAGRNFEYFSEDPLLAGYMGAAEVKGIQSLGVGCSVKHFALNNAENYRMIGNSLADERAIREIYLKPFEYIIKEAKPYTIMCAYNKVNDVYCSENKRLLKEILRDEWNYDGLVMTDWGAMHNRVKSIQAGLDFEMPGDNTICKKWLKDAINDKTLDIKDLDIAVKNVLNLINKVENNKKIDNPDFESHNELARTIAEDSAVLLKNDNNLLPLAKDEKYLIVGELFSKMRYQGAGSSMINPTKVTSPELAFKINNVNYEYCKGYLENSLEIQEDLINETIKKADNYDKIIIFAGLTDYVESEGSDRQTLSLPNNQLELINKLIELNKKIVVVLFGGSVMELPFVNKVDSILNMVLPGQNGGTATYNILFGNVSPSGKLAESFVKSYCDVPFGDNFSKTSQEVYKESIFVGYRYYQTYNKEVLYPFGYGLSYTKFEYSNLNVEKTDKNITISFSLKNVGNYDGAEVCQLYVKGPDSDILKPLKELKGFKKVYLKKNEEKNVTIIINEDDLRYWNILENRFVLETGDYELLVSSDSQTVKLKDVISIIGEKLDSPYSKEILDAYKNNILEISDEIWEKLANRKVSKLAPLKPITIESRMIDLKQTFFGRILFNAVLGVARKQLRKAKKMKDGKEKENAIKGAYFLEKILINNSINSMSMTSSGIMPYNFAEGFVYLSNGKIFKAIKAFCSKIK